MATTLSLEALEDPDSLPEPAYGIKQGCPSSTLSCSGSGRHVWNVRTRWSSKEDMHSPRARISEAGRGNLAPWRAPFKDRLK